jgi:hypothetical protein
MDQDVGCSVWVVSSLLQSTWGAFVRPHWSIIIHDSQECRPVGTQNPMIASEHRDDPIWHAASDQLSKVPECRMENDGNDGYDGNTFRIIYGHLWSA